MTMQAQSPQEKKFIGDTRDNNITKIGLEKKVKKKKCHGMVPNQQFAAFMNGADLPLGQPDHKNVNKK